MRVPSKGLNAGAIARAWSAYDTLFALDAANRLGEMAGIASRQTYPFVANGPYSAWSYKIHSSYESISGAIYSGLHFANPYVSITTRDDEVTDICDQTLTA